MTLDIYIRIMLTILLFILLITIMEHQTNAVNDGNKPDLKVDEIIAKIAKTLWLEREESLGIISDAAAIEWYEKNSEQEAA